MKKVKNMKEVKGMAMWLLLPFGVLAGSALAVQFSVNAQLRPFVGGPMIAAAISFLIGTVALLVASMVFRQSWTLATALASAPWWAWAGGLLGAFYVLATVIGPVPGSLSLGANYLVPHSNSILDHLSQLLWTL